MTSTLTAPATPQAGTSVAPTGRGLWRQARWPLAVLGVFIVVATILALLQDARGGDLDPASYDPGGARAIATLAQDRGVPVVAVGDVDELAARLRPGVRIVIADGDAVTSGESVRIGRLLDRTADASLLVVGSRDPAGYGVARRNSDDSLEVVDQVAERSRQPGCTLAAAVRAGSARTGGWVYDRVRGATSCYAGSLLVVPDLRTTLLGSADLLVNDRLAKDGNAALGLALVSEHPDGDLASSVVWFVPRPGRPVADGDRAYGQDTLSDLLPRGLLFGVLQVVIAVVVLALWRARRLGRVVPERLPVVVRGAETVEGRARLYRAAGARPQAAEALRAGARDQLARWLGLPSEQGPDSRAALVEVLSTRLGRPPQDVDQLLFGPPPLDDAGLVRLADDLDRLRAAVQSQASPAAPAPSRKDAQ